MRLNFLCQYHRQAMLEDPDAAKALWLDSRQRLADEAPVPTPHRVNLAGSALEAAGIYLLANPACDARALERYAESALELVAMLVQLGQTRMAIMVVAGANAMVEQLALAGANGDMALAVCRRLTVEGIGLIEDFAGPSDPTARVPEVPSRAVTLH